MGYPLSSYPNTFDNYDSHNIRGIDVYNQQPIGTIQSSNSRVTLNPTNFNNDYSSRPTYLNP